MVLTGCLDDKSGVVSGPVDVGPDAAAREVGADPEVVEPEGCAGLRSCSEACAITIAEAQEKTSLARTVKVGGVAMIGDFFECASGDPSQCYTRLTLADETGRIPLEGSDPDIGCWGSPAMQVPPPCTPPEAAGYWAWGTIEPAFIDDVYVSVLQVEGYCLQISVAALEGSYEGEITPNAGDEPPIPVRVSIGPAPVPGAVSVSVQATSPCEGCWDLYPIEVLAMFTEGGLDLPMTLRRGTDKRNVTAALLSVEHRLVGPVEGQWSGRMTLTRLGWF